jgi:hypothetical protein
VRRTGNDFAAPAVRIERALDEAVAYAGGDLRLRILLAAGVIADDLEATAVKLGNPAFDRDFPVGVPVEEAADDPDPDPLAGLRRWR